MSQNMEETYELGDSVLLKRQFFDNNGSGLYDPDTIILRTKDPVGNVETRTPLDNASVGNYSFEFVALTEGEWAYEWKAESAAHGDTIHGGKFTVQASVIDSLQTALWRVSCSRSCLAPGWRYVTRTSMVKRSSRSVCRSLSTRRCRTRSRRPTSPPIRRLCASTSPHSQQSRSSPPGSNTG